jgi:hypothetical protein
MANPLIAALVLAVVAAVPAAVAMECRDDPAVVAACFTARGRLAIAPSGEIQIWPSGTKRLLQLTYPANLPQSLTAWPYISPRLEKLLRAGEAEVWGDFEVCPLTHDIPGQRRLICIQSGSGLRVVDNPRYGEFAKGRKEQP